MAKFLCYVSVAIALIVIHLTHGDESCSITANLPDPTFDMDAYKKSFQTQVAVPYKTAITTIASNIIEYLAEIPVPTAVSQLKMVAITLNIEAQEFSSQLRAASNSSNVLMVYVDRKAGDLIANGSTFQTQLKGIDEEIDKFDKQTRVLEDQIEHALSDFESSEKTGYFHINPCFLDRGIEEAKRRGVYYLCEQVRASVAQNNALSYKKICMAQYIDQVNQLRDKVMDLDSKLKHFVSNIRMLFAESKVLAEAIKELIDLETVIDPLTSIADQILGFLGFTPNAADATYLGAMKQKIALNLPIVKLKLSQYELLPVKVW